MRSYNSSPKVSRTSENKNLSVKCVFCHSKNYIKWGKRKTAKRGFIQTFKCRECNKRFTNNDGFYRMRNHENKISPDQTFHCCIVGASVPRVIICQSKG